MPDEVTLEFTAKIKWIEIKRKWFRDRVIHHTAIRTFSRKLQVSVDKRGIVLEEYIWNPKYDETQVISLSVFMPDGRPIVKDQPFHRDIPKGGSILFQLGLFPNG